MVFDFSVLRGRLRETGMTQADLCRAIGVSPSTLSMKLSGKADFRQDEIMTISEFLQIRPEDIPRFFFQKKV